MSISRHVERSGALEDQDDKELVQLVYVGEVRSHEGVRRWLNLQAKPSRGPKPTRDVDGTGVGNAVAAVAGTSTQTPQQEEAAISRVLDALSEAYRRLARPEKVGSTWSAERWAALSQVLAKLRTLAATARWVLPDPARLLSMDPKVLAETGIEDATLAGQAVDTAEAMVEARVLRIAVRLASQPREKRKSSKVSPAAWVPQEVCALAGMVLTHMRSIGLSLERLLSGEDQEQLMEELCQVYAGLAAGLASLRRRLGEEAHRVLKAAQDPLWAAAKAACSLGVVVRPETSQFGWAAVKEKFSVQAQSQELAIKALKMDSFAQLHQATLLTSISSFAELGSVAVPEGSQEETEQRVQRLIESILGAEGHERKALETPEAAAQSEYSLAPWNVEFTSKQLRAMQGAVGSGQPKVAGAQALLQDTLNGYSQLSAALGLSYSVEKALRASPAKLQEHEAVVELVLLLQEAWRDAGALLTASRQADLAALERTRLKHMRLVVRAYRIGGEEMATMVLARLVLVDEMLLPPSERRLTSEVPFTMDKPYKLCQSVIRGLDQAGKVNPRRRRRWLRCPHANMRVVLAGEVWRQLMSRYLATDVAFEPLNACIDLPLSLRDFRIAASFLEVNLSERVAGLVYEVCADTAGCNGEATLYSLQKVLSRYGARGCGHWGVAVEQAASQLKFSFAPTWNMMQEEDSQVPSRSQSPKSPSVSPAAAPPAEGPSSLERQNSAAAKVARRLSCRRMSGAAFTQEQASGIAHELQDKASQEENHKRRLSGHRRMSGAALPDQAVEIAQELKEQKEEAHNRRISSHRRMSGAAMPEQAAGIASELNEQTERRRSNLASQQKRGSTLQPPTPAGSSRPVSKGFRRLSGAMAKVALLQPPAKPKAKPVPMACPRCLKGDIPSFPYVSVGELSRTHSTPVDESTSPSADSAESIESEGELQPDDPEAAKELGEDIVLSWATGVLTDGVVLCKDERGDYFRWLARIVLYDMLDEDVLQERAKSRGSSRGDKDGGPNNQTSQQSKASGGSKRMSFLQALSAASASLGSQPTDSLNEDSTQTISTSPKSKASGQTSTSFMSLIHDLTGNSAKAQAAQKRKADEAQQIKEADRDWSIPIPDLYLARMRVDLGVRLSNDDKEEDLRSGEAQARRGSTVGALLAKHNRRVDRQTEMRAEREAEMLQTLHFLSVPELELQSLRKELALAAELPPNPTGLLLVGGTPQVAQRILVPKNTRRPVPRNEQDEQEALKKALAALQKQGRSAADMAAHTEVRRIAKEIVHLSAENASSCYHMAGYEDQVQKDRVAAALRLLEHELFHAVGRMDGVVEGAAAAEAPLQLPGNAKDSSLKTTAPLLLTKQTAKRLIHQAAREEAEAQAAAQPPTVEAVRLEPRRKARVKEALNQSMSDLSDKDSDDSARSDLADTGQAGRARRRWSDQRLNSMLQRDYSPISNTPRVSASRTPQQSEAAFMRSRGGLTGVLESEHVDEEFCPDVIDWHPSVKSLLDSVSRRGARVRNTARPIRNEALKRCASDSAVAQLPLLSPEASASPQRGAKGRGKKGFHKANLDQFQLEGWRAKIAPSDVGSLSGAGLLPKVEHEGMLR